MAARREAGGGRGYPTGKLPELPAGVFNAHSTLENSKLRKEFVDIPVGEVKLHTWIVYPEGDGKAPVVLAMHHGPGLDEWQRALGVQLAEQGFISVTPDLLSGFGPNGGNYDSFDGTDAVMRGLARLTQDDGIRRLKAAYEYGMKLPRASGKSATIGFCMGGGYSFRFAGEVPEINGAVVFYGGAPSEQIMARIKSPVLGFFGEDDARVTAGVAPATAAMEKLGKTFESHIYPHATHGFLEYQDLAGNPQATSDSWSRTIAFLKTTHQLTRRGITMNITRFTLCTIIFTLGIGSAVAQEKGKGNPPGPGLTLTSPDFEDGGVIPNKYTQAVPDAVSPKLEWTHVPPGTVSFALILHDPDAALQRKTDDVLHWMIFNIPAPRLSFPKAYPLARPSCRMARFKPRTCAACPVLWGQERRRRVLSSLHVRAVCAGHQAQPGSGRDPRGCSQVR